MRREPERPATAASQASIDRSQITDLIQILQKQTEESLAMQNAAKDKEMDTFKEQCVK